MRFAPIALTFVLPLVLSVSGCFGAPCGEMAIRTTNPYPAADPDGDGYLDLKEGCGEDDGSFGFQYPEDGITQLLFAPSSFGPEVGDYLIVTELYFLTKHLQVGAKLGAAELGGYGMHKPTGIFNDPTVAWRFSDVSLEVLAGPRPGDFEEQVWKFRWRIVVGGSEGEPRGQQFLEGEDWIPLGTGIGRWRDEQHSGGPPDRVP